MKKFEWISVEDGLPEAGGVYLFRMGANDYDVGYFDHYARDVTTDSGYYEDGEYTHWSHIPEPEQ